MYNYYLITFRGNIKTEVDKLPLTLLSKYVESTDKTDVMVFVNNGKEFEIIKSIYSPFGRFLKTEYFPIVKQKENGRNRK